MPKNSKKLLMLQRRHKRMQIMLQRKLLTQLKRIQLIQKLLTFSQLQMLFRLLLIIKLPPETLSNLTLMHQSLHRKIWKPLSRTAERQPRRIKRSLKTKLRQHQMKQREQSKPSKHLMALNWKKRKKTLKMLLKLQKMLSRISQGSFGKTRNQIRKMTASQTMTHRSQHHFLRNQNSKFIRRFGHQFWPTTR